MNDLLDRFLCEIDDAWFSLASYWRSCGTPRDKASVAWRDLKLFARHPVADLKARRRRVAAR